MYTNICVEESYKVKKKEWHKAAKYSLFSFCFCFCFRDCIGLYFLFIFTRIYYFTYFVIAVDFVHFLIEFITLLMFIVLVNNLFDERVAK